MAYADWKNDPVVRHKYLRSRRGTLHPPYYHLGVVMAHGVDDLADEVAEAIVTTANTNTHTRPPDYRTPDLVAEEGLGIPESERNGSDEVYRAVMELALWYAKLDPRYWGIRDPGRETYCSECRTGVSKDEFSHSDTRCDRHYGGLG